MRFTKTLYERQKRKEINYSASAPVTKSQTAIFAGLILGFIVFIGVAIVCFMTRHIVYGILSIITALASFAGVFIYGIFIIGSDKDAKVTVTKSNIDYTYNGFTGESVDNSTREIRTKTVQQLLAEKEKTE